jgi:hypothetical protein
VKARAWPHDRRSNLFRVVEHQALGGEFAETSERYVMATTTREGRAVDYKKSASLTMSDNVQESDFHVSHTCASS